MIENLILNLRIARKKVGNCENFWIICRKNYLDSWDELQEITQLVIYFVDYLRTSRFFDFFSLFHHILDRSTSSTWATNDQGGIVICNC